MQRNVGMYDVYKDSGVPWIGKIPEDWDVLPGRACLYENKEKNTGMLENTVLSLSYGRIRVKPEDEQTGLVPESYETYQIVRPGDIIVRGTDLQNDVTSLRTGLARDHGIITSAYINLRPQNNILPVYLHYLLHSYDLTKVYYGLGSGLRQNLSYDDFKYLIIVLPDLETQNRIVEYLDKKAAEIDEAIGKKRRLIELLNEQKAILINRTVTRGLDPSVPMKDSGVDWIGEIPAHWEAASLKHYCSLIKDGLHHTPEKFDQGVNFISTQHVRHRRVSISEATKISSKDYFLGHKTSKPEAGDVLITLVGSIGFAAIIEPTHLPLSCTRHVGYVRCADQKLSPEFVVEYFESTSFKGFVGEFVSQTAQPSIYLATLADHKIPLPPYDEQVLIAAACKEFANQFDPTLEREYQGIEVLNEFKQTLIANAVTGKIKI